MSEVIQEPELGQEPSGQDQEQNIGTATTTEEGGETSSPKTVEVLGREYNLSDINQVLELAKDYDRLGRQYSPLTQRLAELEQIVKSVQQQPQADFNDPDTVAYLRSLGFVHKEEMAQKEEDERIENTLKSLESTYNGSDGRPKFDRRAVLEFCVANNILNPEYGYKILNWDALREWELRQAKSAPPAPPSSGGEGGSREPQPKKRVFGLPKEGEVDIREAMLETLEKSTPTPTA